MDQAKQAEHLVAAATVDPDDTDIETGLNEAEAMRRLERFGPNAIEEKHTSPMVKFLSFFWGPIP